MEKLKIAQIIASVVGISVGQLLLKIAATNLRNPDTLGFWLLGFRINAYLFAGFAVLGISTLIWVWILREVPLSVAYPFMALAFIFVPILGWLVLNEPLTYRQISGGLLICLGLILASR